LSDLEKNIIIKYYKISFNPQLVKQNPQAKSHPSSEQLAVESKKAATIKAKVDPHSLYSQAQFQKDMFQQSKYIPAE
jgi:hypothetical protein